ncbi:S-ribosylhomocysteine lyase [Candidatus Saccharibacteria bacterium]|nr:S-ribosylhomocysteine lyase [Candidatus Saccharibacteria bacterium]
MIKLGENATGVKSFKIDHRRLRPGLYSDTKAYSGRCITTIDMRLVQPNSDDNPPLSTAAMHTIEHLGANYLRSNKEWEKAIIYFGPMGCRTGFYAVLDGPHPSVEQRTRHLFLAMAKHIVEWPEDKPIPGATEEECGNYRDHDIQGAKAAMQKWLEVFDMEKEPNYYPFSYPE